MQRETIIRKIETRSLLQGIWPSVDCCICHKCLGEKCKEGVAILQEYCFIADIQTVFHEGKLYPGLRGDTCSEEHAQQFIDAHKEQSLSVDGGNTLPSQARNRTIYAVRHRDDYPQETLRSGKWLLFPLTTEIDAVWVTIRDATRQGLLGGYSKVCYNQHKAESMICVYTYDYADREDVSRIRQALRQMGFTHKLAYKADETTSRGIYKQPGQRVSLYYE